MEINPITHNQMASNILDYTILSTFLPSLLLLFYSVSILSPEWLKKKIIQPLELSTAFFFLTENLKLQKSPFSASTPNAKSLNTIKSNTGGLRHSGWSSPRLPSLFIPHFYHISTISFKATPIRPLYKKVYSSFGLKLALTFLT